MKSSSSVECKSCGIEMKVEDHAIIDIGVKHRVLEKLCYKCPNCNKHYVQRRIIYSTLKPKR